MEDLLEAHQFDPSRTALVRASGFHRGRGNDQLIRNMRRGQVPSVTKFRRLCEVLGLEFYAGPPREIGTVDGARLKEAIEVTEQTLEVEGVELEPQDKARVLAAVYELIGEERSPATVSRVKQLIAGMTAGTRTRTGRTRG